jgi:hypothetical protein
MSAVVIPHRITSYHRAAEQEGKDVTRMKAPNYEASWVPGLDRKVDRDKSLALGFRWLESAESQHDTPGVVVLHAKRMIPNTPLLAQAATRWEFVSPRSRRPRAQGPALAIWPPNDRVLELAEDLADGSALCVISGHLLDVAPWVRRTGAQCLMDGLCVAGGPSFPPEVTKGLDRMLFFGGHHSFLDTGEKEDAIQRLRAIAARPDAPTSPQIEDYLRASGATDARGIIRAAKWYGEILEGRRHLDRRGHVIR